MSFRLIRNPEDWTEHQAAVLRESNLTGMTVTWGTGPAEFPCLAATMPIHRPMGVSLVSAYVYVANAVQLLQAAGKHVGDRAPENPKIDVARALHDFQHDQVRFNQSLLAQMLAVISFIRHVGIATDEQFEAKYNESLQIVDEDYTRRKDHIAALKEQERLTEARLLERSMPDRSPDNPDSKPGC